MSWYRPWRRRRERQAMELLDKAVGDLQCVTGLYSSLVDRYLQLLDENLKLKQQIAEQRAMALTVDEYLKQHKPNFVN